MAYSLHWRKLFFFFYIYIWVKGSLGLCRILPKNLPLSRHAYECLWHILVPLLADALLTMFLCLQTDWDNGNYAIHLAVSCEPKYTANFLSAFSLMEEIQVKVQYLKWHVSLCWLWIFKCVLSQDMAALVYFYYLEEQNTKSKFVFSFLCSMVGLFKQLAMFWQIMFLLYFMLFPCVGFYSPVFWNFAIHACRLEWDS